MARKQGQVETPPEEAPGKRGFLWLWILLAVVCFGLFVALLHVSGALRGVEEAFYQKVKGVPVIGFLASPLHKESWEGRLTPDQVIDVKDLRRELLKTQNTVSDLKKMKKSVKSLGEDVSAALESIEKVQRSLKDMEETYTPGAAAAAPAAPGAAPGAPALSIPTAAEAQGSVQTENYRAVSKIFEKIDAETAVDIFSNLTDEEIVEILNAMKESTVADIFVAMEPTTAATLSKMLARKKAGR
ncbi:MAG: hypothetical protein ABIH66_00440 [bacterium]